MRVANAFNTIYFFQKKKKTTPNNNNNYKTLQNNPPKYSLRNRYVCCIINLSINNVSFLWCSQSYFKLSLIFSATETLIYDSMKVYPKSQSSTPYGQYPLNTELTLSCSALVESESRDLTWCIYTGYSTKAMEYDTVKRSRVRMNKPCAYHLLSEIQYVLSESNVFTWIICKFGTCDTSTDKSNVFSAFTCTYQQHIFLFVPTLILLILNNTSGSSPITEVTLTSYDADKNQSQE